MDASQILIVIADEELFRDKIEHRIAELDQAMKVLSSERVETIQVEEGDAREIAQTLSQMYGRGFKSKTGQTINALVPGQRTDLGGVCFYDTQVDVRPA